jgi:glycerate 2-kinase
LNCLPGRLTFDELTIAVDVDNPLLGPNGATRIYGRQKGLLSAEDVLHAEACLQRLAEVCAQHAASEAGAGAGGGLGFGLSAFASGSLVSGGDLFSTLTQLPQRIRDVDCVITAEGRMDQQTLMGKGVGLVAATAAAAGKQCLCLAGSVSADTGPIPWPRFQAFPIVPDIADLQEALAHPKDCLRRLAAKVAGLES